MLQVSNIFRASLLVAKTYILSYGMLGVPPCLCANSMYYSTLLNRLLDHFSPN